MTGPVETDPAHLTTVRTTGATPVTTADVDAIRAAPDAAERIAELLREQSPVYAGRGTGAADRLRGYLLASLESVGLPAGAEPYVLAELESGLDPHAVAGAARALRGAVVVPPDAPELLVAAMIRLRAGDDYVSFRSVEPSRPDPDAVTAVTEIARTLAALGPRARAARAALIALAAADRERFAPAVRAEIDRALAALGRPALSITATGVVDEEPVTTRVADDRPRSLAPLADLPMQDQDGRARTLGTALGGRPSVLGFFYTRCDNPLKCSLTISKLAEVAIRLTATDDGAAVAAITYDPAFDDPRRLRRYGAARGLRFGRRCLLLRTVGPFDPLRAQLDLGVGYGPVTVNRHRIDLLVLDPAMTVHRAFVGRLWDPGEVAVAVHELTGNSSG